MSEPANLDEILQRAIADLQRPKAPISREAKPVRVPANASKDAAMAEKTPAELRGAVSALLPLIDDAGLLKRILSMLASGVAGGPSRSPSPTPPQRPRRIVAGTVELPTEHLEAVRALIARFGLAEAGRRLSLTHQTVVGVTRSEGRCFPQTAAAIAEGLARIDPADLEPLEGAQDEGGAA